MSETATPTPALPHQGGGGSDVDAALTAYEPVYQRMERMREGLLKRFTKWELGWLLAEDVLFWALGERGGVLEGIDRAEAKLVERGKKLRHLSRLAASNRRAARLDAELDRMMAGKPAAPKRRRRKRKAVR